MCHHVNNPKRNPASVDCDKCKVRNYHRKLRQRYGITLEEYDRMFALQSGVCAICKQPENDAYKRRLSVDHDHETGKVRGLLCHQCNTGIGKFGDDIKRLLSAAKYLKLHEEID